MLFGRETMHANTHAMSRCPFSVDNMFRQPQNRSKKGKLEITSSYEWLTYIETEALSAGSDCCLAPYLQCVFGNVLDEKRRGSLDCLYVKPNQSVLNTEYTTYTDSKM